MDFIREIPIHTEEEALRILKSEITFGSIFGELANAPKIKRYGLTKENAKGKINYAFTNSNTNRFSDGLMADNIDDAQKAFESLFVGSKVTVKINVDGKNFNESVTDYVVKVKGVGKFHVKRNVKRRTSDTCRMDYTLENGTAGILVDNRDNGKLRVNSANARQFVINLNYKPTRKLKVKKL